jgi:hypothetical protein
MGSYSNSKDQISLEEAYKTVHNPELVSESLVDTIHQVFANTQHLPASIQGLITLASFAVPGAAGAGLVAGIQHLLNKFKAIKDPQERLKIAARIQSKEADDLLAAFKKAPNEFTGEKILRVMELLSQKAADQHVEDKVKALTDTIRGHQK